jgi:glycosyltransferase involved in cell wall biosynthesis
MDKLLFTGELPPNSINGISYSNKINLDILKQIFQIYIIEDQVNLADHKKFTIKKVYKNLQTFIKILKSSIIHNFKYFYLVLPTSTLGILKTILFIIIFKTFNYNSKIVLHLHRGDLSKFIKKSSINSILLNICFKFSYKFITLSEIDKKYLIQCFPKYKYIFTNLTNATLQNLRIDFNKNYNDIQTNFIYVSNYIEEKGILDLLDTFKLCGNDFKLSCYGNFTDNKLKEKILTYSSDNIFINGPIYDDIKFIKIRESDCLILPSYNEGMPLILIESMSVGTPFITTSVGFINEMIYEGYPFIYENTKPTSLFEMVQKFAQQNFDDYSELSKKLLNYYKENYSLNVHEIKLKKIFLNES